MTNQILHICRTKDQICRCLIELLQILILFPSDRRQKYDTDYAFKRYNNTDFNVAVLFCVAGGK